MRRELLVSGATLLSIALPIACGSLNKGEVVIVDNAGSPATGGDTAVSGSGNPGAGRGGRGGRAGGTSGRSGGDSGEAGQSGGGGVPAASGGTGGSSGGTGGSSTSGGESGSAGGPTTECQASGDCDAVKPICDDSGECRKCSTGAECRARDAGTPFCATDGTCVECAHDIDCPAVRPICEANACRKCQAGSECNSLACDARGRCADESAVVYALAQTGDTGTECGTKDKPCYSLGTAAGLLSTSRPYLVLIPTTSKFDASATLPANTDVIVFGNHVTVESSNTPAFTIVGGTVVLNDVVANVSKSPTLSNPLAAIDCQGANLALLKGEITNSDADYNGYGLNLLDCTADVQQVKFTGNHTALNSTSAATPPTQGLTVERSLFEANTQAINVVADHFTIRNNLFVSNGQTSYVRIVLPSGETSSMFAFNTLWGNDNNCSYEGGLIACEGGSAKCGVLTSNITWDNMYNGSGSSGAMPCPDQVYETPPPIHYSISETTWSGDHNKTVDPMFTDSMNGDFSLVHGSPAIDAGDSTPATLPDVDYFGNPRVLGGGPDMGAIESE